MALASRNPPGEIVETRKKHVNEQFRYHHYEQSRPQEAPVPAQDQTVPVLLCHTCSVCGQMRSAGYHRHNPVVPGKPLVLTPCRKCKKKVQNERRSMSRVTRVRSCTAETPCDWPSEDVYINMQHHEDRGRRRSRDIVYVYADSPDRPHIFRQSSSMTRLGLRALQPNRDGQHEVRTTRARISSLSPRRASSYGELHPAPDVGLVKDSKQKEQGPPHPFNPKHDDHGDVWPRPDGIYAHLYRKAETDAPRRTSSRIVELPPSPSPARTRTTEVEHQSESVERRYRSVSPPRVVRREERRTENAEARLKQHPQPFRAVRPEERNFRAVSDETSTTTTEHVYHERRRRRESPSRGILKSTVAESRRQTLRESEESTAVNTGGSRVHFDSYQREERQIPDDRGRSRHVEDVGRGEDSELYHSFARHRYPDDSEPEPPIEEFERVRIRRRSPLPRRVEEEIRIDHQRRLSPFPPRHVEDVHIRRVAPLPRREPSPPAPARPVPVSYRHVSHEQVVRRSRSITPPPVERPASDDVTDTDSAHSGEVIEAWTFKAIDENGKPATYIEERRRHRMLEQGSDRGSHAEFRALSDRLPRPLRSVRDV